MRPQFTIPAAIALALLGIFEVIDQTSMIVLIVVLTAGSGSRACRKRLARLRA